MSDKWNPTIKTRNGEELSESSFDGHIPPYRKESVLQKEAEAGLTARQIAEKYGASRSVVRRYIRRFDIETKAKPDPDTHSTAGQDLHEAAGIDWFVNPNVSQQKMEKEPVADGGSDLAKAIGWLCEMYDCPDCGRSYLRPKDQHDCMRSHARALADGLADEPLVLG